MVLLANVTPHSSVVAVPTAPSESLRRYEVRLARTPHDVAAVQRLRFRVFNLELGAGLADSYATGRDEDHFDRICDHLLVENLDTGAVVGTYRIQSGKRAAEHEGYYSEREFDFAPYEKRRARILELGRACIDQDHRSFAVLNLLWTGIAWYARESGARFLMGCSSIHSNDPATAVAAARQLERHLIEPTMRTVPRPGFDCPQVDASVERVSIPKLLKTYLSFGAEICAPPAIDHAFGTIDFLTSIDLASPTICALQARGRFARVT